MTSPPPPPDNDPPPPPPDDPWAPPAAPESEDPWPPDPEPAPAPPPPGPAPATYEPPPGTPQWDPPADPAAGGDRQQPAEQQWDQPAEQQQWDQPTDQQWEQPAEQQWEQPAEPAAGEWQQPAEQQHWEQPAEPQWEQPAEPAAGEWQQPAEQQWDPPAGPPAGEWQQPAETYEGDGANPPPAEPWTPSGFQPEWTIEPAPAEAGGPGGAALWPPPPVGDPAAGAGGEAPPPSSPAYSAPSSDAYSADAPPPMVATASAPPRRRRRGALIAAVAALAVLVAGVAALALRGGGGDDGDGLAFGKVSATGHGAQVTPAAGQQAETLAKDDSVRAGTVVKTPGDATVTVDLEGGGVVRFDKGATVSFLDLALDPDTGRRTGESRPALQVDGGRVWVNPGGDSAPRAVRLRLPGGDIVSRHNPMAVDCTVSCRLEAPSGGVTFTSSGGLKATPGTGESVDFDDPQHLDLLTSSDPSEWARRNLIADRDAPVGKAVRDDGHSVKDGALLDGSYRLSLSVTGPPKGADIPDDLKHQPGQRGAATLEADGGECVTTPCDVAVRGENGAEGTARVADGKVTITLTQPIPCRDTSGHVVNPDIGTSTLKITLDVLDAAPEGKRWVASSFTGTGTLASTMSTPCTAEETLGTSTSPIAVSAAPTA